jgi:diacylglycerol kinase family enzyme
VKRFLGRAGYLFTAVHRFAVQGVFRCRLAQDGETTETEALDLRIANGPYHGGVVAVPDAAVDSGDLVVRLVPRSSALARMWGRTALRLSPDRSAYEIVRVREVTIETDPMQFVSVDGEVVTQTPIRVSVVPGALKLMVP